MAPLLESRPGRPRVVRRRPRGAARRRGSCRGERRRRSRTRALSLARRPRELALDPRERTRALLEAGAAALARGPDYSSEAELYLDEARRSATPGFDAIVLAFSALALDRTGQADHARALGLEVSDPWSLERLLGESERAAAGAPGRCPARRAPEPSARDALRDPRRRAGRSRRREPTSRSRSSSRAASFTRRSPCWWLRAIRSSRRSTCARFSPIPAPRRDPGRSTLGRSSRAARARG